MRSLCALLPVAFLLAACASTATPTDPLAARVHQIAGRIAKRHGEQAAMAVAYRDAGTGASLFVLPNQRMHPASTMKVPVMMALFDAVDRGEMRLDQPVPVRNRFESIMDGSPYELDPAEDGDPDLYQAAGGTKTLEELIRRMIVRSSNLATNLLIERIGATRVTDLTRQLGAEDLRVLRGVEDDKAFQAGMNNVTTAKDLLVLLEALLPEAQGSPFSPASRERMLEILKAQEFNEKIPAGLPPGTPVAHKTGDITGIHHDAAVVFPPGERPYVLVVLTRGILDEKEADATIAEISRAVWEERRR
ncbi:MAG TPA: serine hydrolase [Thermoanaerobaculia bacterium]|nr:serine hydrolase [Thermoanaerobaculia bacterium]